MGKDQSNRRTSQSNKPIRPLSFAKVVLETSVPHLDREFDYQIPENLTGTIRIGTRVLVPFGRQRLNGWVVELFSKSNFQNKIAAIIKPIGSISTLKPQILDLAQFTATHFAGTVSDVLRFAIPPRHVKTENDFLKADTGDVEKKSLEGVLIQPQFILLNSTEKWQHVILNELTKCLNEQKKVLLVVPEHSHIISIIDELRDFKNDVKIAVLSAESPAAERYKNFLDVFFQKSDVVVGTRNAIFAPLEGNFTIIIYQEYSDIFQSPQAPYWNVSTVARYRTQLEKCNLIYVGYGMSVQRCKDILDSQLDLVINQEAPIRSSQVVVDTKSKINNESEFSSTLWQALAESKYGPVLVQVPRKGLANLLRCGKCFRVLSCASCSGMLKLIDNSTIPACVRCSNLQPRVECQVCGSAEYQILQSGQVGVLRILGSRFPGVKIYSSTREKRIMNVNQDPSIAVCTPGAAPEAKDGYRAIVILNALTQFSYPKLEIFQDTFNQWLGLLAQLKNHPQAKFVINGEIDEDFYQLFNNGKAFDFAAFEYQQRIKTDLPPALHSVIFRGMTKQINGIAEHVTDEENFKVLGPVVDPTNKEVSQLAVLDKNFPVLLKFATKITKEVSAKGKANLQIKVDSIDFI